MGTAATKSATSTSLRLRSSRERPPTNTAHRISRASSPHRWARQACFRSSSDPALGNITYDELARNFHDQAAYLIEGGVDVLLIETSQDILEVKAAVAGIEQLFNEIGRRIPIQAQVTLDVSGRMLLGTDIASAMTTLESLGVDVIGLNCSTGPEHMREPIRYLSENATLPALRDSERRASAQHGRWRSGVSARAGADG